MSEEAAARSASQPKEDRSEELRSEELPPPRLVRDLMSVGVPTCGPEVPIVEVTRLMLEKDLEAVVVLDKQGHAQGVVSRHDLVRVYAQGEAAKEPLQSLTAGEVMQADLPQVPPDIPLPVAAQIMQDQGVRVLYMMHHAGGIAYPAALLTYKHILRHLAMESQSDLNDLGIKAEREAPLETFIRRRDEARNRARKGG
jgi:CBS domain-containing protein